MGDVRLVDLEVIKRYSLAVRRDTVPAAELLEALDASRDLVQAALAGEAPADGTARRPRSATPAAAKRAPGKRAAAGRAAAGRAATGRAATDPKPGPAAPARRTRREGS
jgi:hypothetical protein